MKVVAGAVVSNTEGYRILANETVGKTDPDLNDMSHPIENKMILVS